MPLSTPIASALAPRAAAARTQGPRPADLWRAALETACVRLEALGFAPEEALEIAESAVIACALRHEPSSASEAEGHVLREAGLDQPVS